MANQQADDRDDDAYEFDDADLEERYAQNEEEEDDLDDPDEDDSENGSLEPRGNIFEPKRAGAEGQEGSFRDDKSTFANASGRGEDHRNPYTTMAQEIERWQVPDGKKVQPKRNLVAKWPKDGSSDIPQVAYCAGGKMLEAWRAPTAAELDALRKRGRIVKGGIVGETALATAPSFPWKKAIAITAGVGVVGFGGWWLYKRYRDEADGEVRVSR